MRIFKLYIYILIKTFLKFKLNKSHLLILIIIIYFGFKHLFKLVYTIKKMAQNNTITPARQAMLELIKNNRNNRKIAVIIITASVTIMIDLRKRNQYLINVINLILRKN